MKNPSWVWVGRMRCVGHEEEIYPVNGRPSAMLCADCPLLEWALDPVGGPNSHRLTHFTASRPPSCRNGYTGTVPALLSIHGVRGDTAAG
jgi:hypothetical protein